MVSDHMGRAEFEKYRSVGECARFLTEKVSTMNRDELLAVIGWMQKSNDWWREFSTKRMGK